MATTYPLATLAPTVSATGISAPSYNDIYQSLIASFQAIYGSSIYVQPDSQDGQWIAVLAKAIFDSNMAAVAVFQSFSPVYAQGVGLSSLVKLNGITRNVATNSQAVGTVIGQAGSVILNGVVRDANGNLWNLPNSVTIPTSGSISVTVTAQALGNIVAPAGTINQIYNPQLGWQSFTSTADATPGTAVETDATLRKRQYASVAMPANSLRESIYAAVANITGVSACTVYDNDTGAVDLNGVPAHSIAVVVNGGDASAIAAAIARYKPPGAQTYGTTTRTVYDQYGLPTQINFFYESQIPVYFNVVIRALPGFSSGTSLQIQQALVAFVGTLGIWDDVYGSQAQAAASLITSNNGSPLFYITQFTMGTAPYPSGTGVLTIPFNSLAVCSNANVNIVVT